ncbi:MAG: hypothetical protein J7J61_09595 [Candidatus Hydrothermae bacterium]|nr:hypothetical protein [Candidatus Hydrothermae bacterium]
MRVKHEAKRRREREYLRYRYTVTKTVERIREHAKRVRDRISDTLRNVRNRVSSIINSATKRNLQKAKETELSDKARLSVDSRDEVNRDILTVQNYLADLDTVINNIRLLSQNGLLFIPSDYPQLNLTKALATYYFTPYIPNNEHFTMYAVKLTPLTVQKLAGEMADFYVSYQVDSDELLNPYVRVADWYMNLFELLLTFMRKKGRREKARGRSKGHYGVIKYDEPIHDMITVSLDGYSTIKLIHCIGQSYLLKRFKAMSLGFPELANRLDSVAVLAILRRKAKYTRRYPDLSKKAELHDRYNAHRYIRR